MAATVRQLESLVRGTPLDVGELLEAPSDVVLLELEPARAAEAWQAARDLVTATGRWPVVCGPGPGGPPEPPDLKPGYVEECLVAAARTSPVTGAAVPFSDEACEVESLVGFCSRFEDPAAALADLRARLGERPRNAAVERWAFERGSASVHDGSALAARALDMHRWEVPFREAWLLWVPDPRPEVAHLYVDDWYGADDMDQLTAMLVRWRDLYGAEEVAEDGVHLVLRPTRRPQPGEQSWQLAGELTELA